MFSCNFIFRVVTGSLLLCGLASPALAEFSRLARFNAAAKIQSLDELDGTAWDCNVQPDEFPDGSSDTIRVAFERARFDDALAGKGFTRSFLFSHEPVFRFDPGAGVFSSYLSDIFVSDCVYEDSFARKEADAHLVIYTRWRTIPLRRGAVACVDDGSAARGGILSLAICEPVRN